jgi:hypothetical protein
MTYLNVTADSIATGANTGFAENPLENSLQAICAGLASVDGNRINVSSFRIKLSLYCAGASKSFGIQPVIVQTAGTFSDINNLVGRTVSALLADAIDDIFGYDLLGNVRFSKIAPSGDGTVAGSMEIIETTITLPAKVLNILNKESESERLQDLYLGYVGIGDTLTLTVKTVYAIEYTEVRQKIMIR